MKTVNLEIAYNPSTYDQGYNARINGLSEKFGYLWSDEFYNGWSDGDEFLKSLKY